MNKKNSNKGNGKGTIKIILLIPFSFVAILAITYIVLYGTNFPFEIRLKTGTVAQHENWVESLTDSLRTLQDAISKAKIESEEYSTKLKKLQEEIQDFRRQHQVLLAKVTKLRTQSDNLKSQIDSTRLARIQNLNKAMKAMQDKEINSLLVQLDSRTLLELLQYARDKQVAMILGALEPKRAAELTKQYLHTK